MAVTGLCVHCSTPTLTSCRMCGRPVCEVHLVGGPNRICVGCASGASLE